MADSNVQLHLPVTGMAASVAECHLVCTCTYSSNNVVRTTDGAPVLDPVVIDCANDHCNKRWHLQLVVVVVLYASTEQLLLDSCRL